MDKCIIKERGYMSLQWTRVLCSAVITWQSNPPSSQFNNLCNEFTSAWSVCVYNTGTLTSSDRTCLKQHTHAIRVHINNDNAQFVLHCTQVKFEAYSILCHFFKKTYVCVPFYCCLVIHWCGMVAFRVSYLSYLQWKSK